MGTGFILFTMTDTNPMKNYDILTPIGAGISSHVYLAQERGTRRLFALKVIRKAGDGVNLDKIRREIAVMRECQNPFIVKYYETFEDSDHIFIQMEYCEGGSLFEFILRKGPLPEDIGLILFTELCFAVKYLHKTKGIIHRDIKLDNVLLDDNCHVRLSDFGFSTVVEDDLPHMRTACGTPAYAAPEMITRDAYTNKTDVWSLGIFLYHLLTGNLPFQGQSIQECMQSILYDEPLFPENMSFECRDLLIHMLDKNQETRYDITEVLSHPLIATSRLFSRIKKVGEWDASGGSADMTQPGMRSAMMQLLGSMSNGYTPSNMSPWSSSCGAVRGSFSLTGKHPPRPPIQGSRSCTKDISFGRNRITQAGSKLLVIHHRTRELPKRPDYQAAPTNLPPLYECV